MLILYGRYLFHRVENTLFRMPDVGTEMLKIEDPMFEGTVIKRENRFLVSVRMNGRDVYAHLHDPGRLRELIYPGASVLLRKTKGEKTSYSITAGFSGDETILVDTRFHNKIGEKFIVKPTGSEVNHGDSRFDFSVDGGFVEIKGCTMGIQDYVIFPDAPSLRGAKHLLELSQLRERGKKAGVIFLLFRKNASFFYPNRITDQKFASAFFTAHSSGVEMLFPKFAWEDGKIIFSGLANLGKDPVDILEKIRENLSKK